MASRASTRLFAVRAGTEQQPFELNRVPAALAAHELVDDYLGLIVIVVGTRLVEFRFLVERRPLSPTPTGTHHFQISVFV